MRPNNDTQNDDRDNSKPQKGKEKNQMGFEKNMKETYSEDDPVPGNGRGKRSQEDRK